ncbi:PAS domain-containing protein [Marivirga arenosa]|uniref:histidine kinase n=1 Tax=Marivirga arenosa TaxID=3059076 RepID=A0AA51ZXL6_9BACT|nr:PAS domain-containing protein [Marivirga sp. BKB1-2]WNB18582.1 PAS domain-containing protein [Marivirga sp. BKB1-2]
MMANNDFKLLEVLSKNSQNIWLVFDKDLATKLFNSSFIKITGFSPSSIKNRSIKQLYKIIPCDLEQLISDLLQQKQTYHNLGSFVVSKQKSNDAYHINFAVYLVYDNEEFDYGIVIGENEINTKNIAQQLKLINHKWRITEKLADLGSWSLDVVNNVAEWSEGMYDLYELNFSDKTYEFEDFIQRVHADDRHQFYELFQRSGQGEKPNRYFNFRIITPSNTIKYIRATVDAHFKDGRLQRLSGINQDISAMVSIEQKDSELSEMFRIAQRFSNMGTWMWNISTNEVSWSDNVYNIFELDKNTFQPDFNRFLRTIPTDEKQVVIDAITKCLEDNESYEIEHSIITQSGDRKWVREKGNVLRNSNGDPVEMYGTVEDITESHKLKSELEFKDEQYQLLAESGQEWIFLLNSLGEFKYTSPALEFLLGFTEREVLSTKFSELLLKGDRIEFEKEFKKLSTEIENQLSIKKRLKTKSGKLIWCETNLKSLIDSKGNFTIRGLTKDITSQVEYEEKLAESNTLLKDANEKYKSLNNDLEAALEQLEAQTEHLNYINKELSIKNDALNQTAIIVESDKNGNIISVNEQFLNLSKYQRNEILGKPHCIKYKSLFNSGIHDKSFFDQIWEKLNNKIIWRGEICNLDKNGDEFWLLKTVIPLINANGNIDRFYSFSSDITLQKQKENDLLNSKNAIEEAAAAKEEFLSVMSHEIRTPLNSVIGLSKLLQKRSPREDQKNLIETLNKSSDNLMHLVNDILDFNKIQNRKVVLDEATFNLSEVLAQLKASFNEQALEKGIELNINEKYVTSIWLNGDVNRLYQILNNLMHNAIKFTEKGSVVLKVKSELDDFYDNRVNIQFEFRDTGIGIAEEQLKFLFSPFQQSEKHISRKYGGTGLGLSIVKGLVELLGGDISLKSKLNTGTVFYINLPFQIAQDHNIQNTSNDKQHDKVLGDYKVLYVEDVPSNQMLIEEFLIDYGAECYIAADSNEALDITAKERFHLILMDLQLPEISGFDLTNIIRNQNNGLNKDTPILAFTAEPSSKELLGKIESAGLQGCIHKPFQFDHLIEKIISSAKKTASSGKVSYNLDYYRNAFKNNEEKLNKIRELLVQDLTRIFEVILNDSYNLELVSEEIHRVKPILKNISCFNLLNLLNDFKENLFQKNEISILRDKIVKNILDLIDSLKNEIKTDKI